MKKSDFFDAMRILEVLRVPTNCLENGLVVEAKYLVCIDDDITSAFYAMDLYHQIHTLYEYYPTILCVGGKGMLSRHTNEKGVSEGKKLRRICLELGARNSDIKVLDKGTNTGLNCLDIYKYLAKYPQGKVIFCVTTRLSLRLERTFAFLPKQYPDDVNQRSFDNIIRTGVYWYVPEEGLNDMMQIYNCKGLAGGIMLLSEIASIYDRIVRYSGKLQAPLEFYVPQYVIDASKRLAKKYPLKINWLCFNGVWQYAYAFFSVLFNKARIKLETSLAVKQVQRDFAKEFKLNFR